MSDVQAQFSVLKQTADPAVADAILHLIEKGRDHELNRVNVLDFSKRNGLDEERVISGFLHASRLGLFDLTWNVLCPGCGGVLDAHSTLKSLRHDDYHCGLCACGYEASVDVQVEPTRERQQLSLMYNRIQAPTGTMTMRPGPLRLSLDNQAGVRVLPSVFIAAEALHHLIGKRKPFLTAKRMLSNQTFRDVFKADNLNIDQRLKITSLTFLFTDLKGSTALYERVGDLAAFDLVRAHFHALLEIISSEKGAVVKTIGDAVMATFIRPENAIVAGLRMRAAMDALNAKRGTRDLVVKIGIHEGPCLAVMLNERQDYLCQTVYIAARVQSLSTSQEIHITGPVIDAPAVAAILKREAITPIQKQAALRGIADKMVVYEIP